MRTAMALAFLLPLASVSARATAAPDDPPPPETPPQVEIGNKTPQPPPPPPLPARAPGAFWVGVALGTGYGWHSHETLETNSGLAVGSGFGASRIGYFGPEVGYQYSAQLAFSAQLRSQYIPKVDTDPTHIGSPHQWAHTVLLRAAYRFPMERFQPFVSGTLGAGEGFRFRIDAEPSRMLDTSDTVRGGPVVFGPGIGAVLPFARRLSLVGEIRALVGAPDFAYIAEALLGVQYDISGQ